MNTKTLIMIAMTLCSFASVMAWPSDRGNYADRQKRILERMQKELSLSSEQSSRIEAALKKNVAAKEKIKGNMKPLYEKMQQLLSDPRGSRKDFEITLRNLSDLRIQYRLLEFDERREMMSILSAEQAEKWQKVMQERRRKFMEKHKNNRARNET
ncbi:MAG: hypothetical protein HS115_13925 [Spirochaetales bacterium]|nr:hypothetical protein [Spirochaetales bacterium]